jgi:hypothetical protein
MSARWMMLACALALVTTLLNSAMLLGQLSSSASARSAAAPDASKLLDDDDFADGLTKLVRKTVRSYCTVGKRGDIDC